MSYGELLWGYAVPKFKVMLIYDVVKGGESARGRNPLALHFNYHYIGHIAVDTILTNPNVYMFHIDCHM